MRNHLLDPVEGPRRCRPAVTRPTTTSLFRQGPARGLGSVRFHDWRPAFGRYAHLPNVTRLRETGRRALHLRHHGRPDAGRAATSTSSSRSVSSFALVVHAQLILEQAALTGLDEDVLDELFAVLVRDFSAHAVELHGEDSATEQQQEWALAAVRRPVVDEARTERVWQRVEALSGAYEMAP